MAKLTTSSVSSGASVTKRETRAHTTRASGTHVLITEQEVLFGTAAAVPLPRPRRIDILPRMLSSVRARWRTRAERKAVRQDHPSKLTYLEHSLMSREMDRF
ncbi:hypothetical protein ACRCUN_06620 [Mycobacterium sp. LTG2003]